MQNLRLKLVLKIAIFILGALLISPVAECSQQEFKSEHSNHKSFASYTIEDAQASSSQVAAARSRQAHFIQLEADRFQQVAVGRPAKFRCVVEDIGDHKVSCTCQLASDSINMEVTNR